MKQRMLSLLLCCVIFCSAFSGDTLTGKAEESERKDSSGLEVHEHTDECYRLETNCLYSDGQKEENSSDTDESHTCTEESGCITRILDCPYKDQDGEGVLPEPEEPEGKEESGDTEEQEKEEEKKPEGEEEPAVILSWEWIDEEEMLVWSEETGQWGLGLPGASEENKVTAEILKGLLPASITASLGEEQTEVLTLDWDFSMLPEEGVWEGSYVLTAGVPEGYVLGEEVTELSVLLEVSEGEVYREPVQAVGPTAGKTDKFVNKWKYVTNKDFAIKGNDDLGVKTDYQYSMDYYLPIISDNIISDKLNKNTLIQKLKATLPQKIECSGSNKDNKLIEAGFIYSGNGAPPTDWSIISGYVNIEWNIEKVVGEKFPITNGEKLVFDAKPVSNDKYRLRVNTNDPNWKDTNKEEADTEETSGILNLTVMFHNLPLEEHIISGVNPANTTVNLFDYRVDTDGASGNDILGKSEDHLNESVPPVPVPRTCEKDWNKGINKNRILLFGDGNIHAGFWNKGAGAGSPYGQNAAGMTGIVKPLLEKGYPVINEDEMGQSLSGHEGISDWQLCGDHIGAPSDQSYKSDDPKNISNTVVNNWKNSENNKHPSLDYLFDPTIGNGDNKRSYTDVKGLFQIDSVNCNSKFHTYNSEY